MDILLDNDGTPVSAGGTPAGDLIKDSDLNGFTTDVLEASRSVPVIVDFWAPWCEPCKTLGPALEKIVKQMAGAVRMVKINVDENQNLAAQMRVQSVPTVYAFKDGQPVDAFQGAVPESQLRAFVDKLTDGAQSPLEAALEQAKALLDGGDPQNAASLYNQVLQAEPEQVAALAGLARCLIASGDTDAAASFLDGLSDKLKMMSEIQAARSALDLAGTGGGDVAALQAKLDSNPDDNDARFDLANSLYAAGDAEAAIEQLLDLVKRDRGWNEEAGRKQLVKLFETLGHTHPTTVAARKRLSTLLFS
ncbi:thioredoxin [Magnetospira sp. QH-2]|uniref:thioredoxin n=1 Tax=Magnetospira sp. (strain QH-2) TaxID=1288970 RepID=UPI0003E81878|nr:thioredoxin [Magnetospira sp. QH-2]CCQ75297.1 putative thioredoxin [Magnetospira sp. QH-2]